MKTMQKRARLTGILILVMAAVAPVGMMIVPSRVMVEGDASATAVNIATHAGLFRLGIACDALICLLEIVISVLLLRLFEVANRTLALTSVVSRLAMTVIQGMNVVMYLAMLTLVTQPVAAVASGTVPVDAWVALLTGLHDSGVYLWQVFFGFHLLTLGVLIWRSETMPRLASMALMAASLGYWAESCAGIWGLRGVAVQGIVGALLVVSTVGELLFAGWLLAKGVRTEPSAEGAGT